MSGKSVPPSSHDTVPKEDLCRQSVPDRYYKIVRWKTGQLTEINVCVGQLDQSMKMILDKIRTGAQLTEIDSRDLVNRYGEGYPKILGLDRRGPQTTWNYLEMMIEIDDSVTNIKEKLAVSFKQSIESIYLFANIRVDHTFKMVGLGHTFVEKIDKTTTKVIEYPANPFEELDNFIKSTSVEQFVDSRGTRLTPTKNDTGDTLMMEYEVLNDDLSLVILCDLMSRIKTDKVIDDLRKKFNYGYLMKYWPYYMTKSDSIVTQLWTRCPTDVAPSEELKNKIERDRTLISLIKNPPISSGTDVIFSDCNLLEIGLHINYDTDLVEYVDLLKIYDRFTLSHEIPFVKYRDEKTKQPIIKLDQSGLTGIPQSLLQDWMANVSRIKNKETDGETVSYHVAGKGLSFKKLLYHYQDPITGQKDDGYATINFYRDGKIEFRCYWKEFMKANMTHVRNAVAELVEMIKRINEIEFQLPGVSRGKLIPLPDPIQLGTADSNTQIAYINTVMQCNFGQPIDFNQIYQFAGYFVTYVTVIAKNLVPKIANPETQEITYQTVDHTALHLRYKRISHYFDAIQMKRFITELVQQSGADESDITSIIAKYYNVSLDEATKFYKQYRPIEEIVYDRPKIEYVLGKSIQKQPGINVRIQGQTFDNYKISVMGAKNQIQLTLIYRFLTNLLRLFKTQEQWIHRSPYNQIFEKEPPKPEIQGQVKDTSEAVESILAELGLEEEEVEEQEPEEETEVITQKTIPPVPSQPKTQITTNPTKRMSALDALKERDPALFGGISSYARECQPVARHPRVESMEIYERNRRELTIQQQQLFQQLKDPHLTPTQKKPIEDRLKIVNDKIDIYNKGLTYHGNRYLCPLLYDIVNQRIPDPGTTGLHITEDVSHNEKYGPYIGFLSSKKMVTEPGGVTHELCLPCCFKKKEHKFKGCVTPGVTTETLPTTSVKYLLTAEKRDIDKDRFAYLPGVLKVIFNNGLENKTGPLYVRKGVGRDSQISGFLSALGDSCTPPQTGQQLRRNIVNKMTIDRFLSLKTGSLKIIFQDDLHPSDIKLSYNNFIRFIEGENIVDEDFLWDYVTSPKVLPMPFSEGINLFILEGVHIIDRENKIPDQERRAFNNITLKCPVGYEIGDLYNLNRSSLVLFRYGSTYEIICHVNDVTDPTPTMERFFKAHHPIIEELMKMLDQCMPETDQPTQITPFSILQTSDLPIETFKDPPTLITTIKQLKPMNTTFQPISQIIDEYNKATHLVLKNGLKLPIKPSSRSTILPIIDYQSIPPMDLHTTLTTIKQISQTTSSLLSLEPLMIVINLQRTQGIGILLTNGLTIDVIPIDLKKLDQQESSPTWLDLPRLPRIPQYHENRYDVDQSLLQLGREPMIDDRVLSVNYRKFEDETYQRLRYELGHLLQDPKNQQATTKHIESVIQDPNQPIGVKRLQLTELLTGLLRQVVTQQRTPSNDYGRYHPPNVRERCSIKTRHGDGDKCLADPHCALGGSDSQQCQLFIEPYNKFIELTSGEKIGNLDRYLALLVEELLKNPVRRNEILNNQVDNTVDPMFFEHHPNEIILTETSHKERQERIRQLYKTGIDYRERMTTFYDVSNPLRYRGKAEMVDLSIEQLHNLSCTQEFGPLTEYWGSILGTSYRVRRGAETTNCIFEAMSMVLNQLNPKSLHTIMSIRGAIADNLERLRSDGKTGKPGWRLLLEYYQQICHQNTGVIQEIQQLKDFIKSSQHQLCLMDLIMISQIYNIKFIILAKERAPLNIEGFVCLGVTPTVADRYVLLYEYGLERYQIIGKIDKEKGPRYIFTSRELPESLFHQWAKVCSLDIKNTRDEPIPVIFSEPVFMTVEVPKPTLTIKHPQGSPPCTQLSGPPPQESVDDLSQLLSTIIPPPSQKPQPPISIPKPVQTPSTPGRIVVKIPVLKKPPIQPTPPTPSPPVKPPIQPTPPTPSPPVKPISPTSIIPIEGQRYVVKVPIKLGISQPPSVQPPVRMSPPTPSPLAKLPIKPISPTSITPIEGQRYVVKVPIKLGTSQPQPSKP